MIIYTTLASLEYELCATGVAHVQAGSVLVVVAAVQTELAGHVTGSLRDRTLFETLPDSSMRRDAAAVSRFSSRKRTPAPA